jgi:hypothetical protein
MSVFVYRRAFGGELFSQAAHVAVGLGTAFRG